MADSLPMKQSLLTDSDASYLLRILAEVEGEGGGITCHRQLLHREAWFQCEMSGNIRALGMTDEYPRPGWHVDIVGIGRVLGADHMP